MKKILHIANWYPNKWDNLEGVFINEQYKLFSEVTDSYLLNVQVRDGKKLLEYKYIKYSESEEGYYFLTKVKSSKIKEWLTTMLLMWALWKSDYKRYDLLHFHIAYPLLIHYFIWKRWIKKPAIISEHWSAYHYNFYMPKETRKLDGIKRIFRQKIPILGVSKALIEDIQNFSGTRNFPYFIIPNVIDMKTYRLTRLPNNSRITFFIINNWRAIKNPFPMFEGFLKLMKKDVDFELRIGGYGELINGMKDFVREHHMYKNVVFLGKLYKKEISEEMNRSDAYLFSSEYETFSVVCAQALCCGNPLIGPAIPAIMEYTDDTERVIVADQKSAEAWCNSLETFATMQSVFNREKIAEKAQKLFSNMYIKKKIGKIYETV